MEKEHAHINGGGCNKLATCLLFYFFHYESGLVLKIIFEKNNLVHIFPHFFHFSFSSTSHRRNGKRTRAHQRWRL